MSWNPSLEPGCPDAVAVDELEVGLTAIAAPVRNAHGDVISSMSLSGPTFRLPPERVDEIVPQLVDAADEDVRVQAGGAQGGEPRRGGGGEDEAGHRVTGRASGR